MSERWVWQPVMLIAEDRVECDCGNRAIFISLEPDEDDRLGVTAWCQDCYTREHERQASGDD